MTKRLHVASNGPTLAAATTIYSSLVGAAVQLTETSSVQQRCRTGGGTFSGLRTYISANSLNTGTSTLKFRKNAANGNLSVSISSGVTGWFEDISNTDTVAQNDQVNLQMITSGASGTITFSRSVIEFDSTFEFFRSSGVSSLGSAATSYVGVNDPGSAQPAESNKQAKFRTAGTLQKSAVYVSTNTLDGSTVFNTRKNTAAGNLSMSISASSTGEFEDTSNSDSIAAGDLVAWEVARGGSSGQITAQRIACEFVPNSSGEAQFCSLPGNGISQGTSKRFYSINSAITAITVEADANTKPVTAFTADKLGVYLSANASGSSSTVNLRQNGSNSALTISVSAGSTGWFEDTANSVSIAGDDLICFSAVAGTSTITLRCLTLKASYAGGGATTWTVSVTESIVETDSTSRQSDASQVVSESWASVDSADRKSDANQLLSDSLFVSDMANRLSDGMRSITDSILVVDSLLHELSSLRAIIDTWLMSDSVLREFSWGFAASDTFLISDLLADPTISFDRNVSDTWLVTFDSLSRIADGLRNPTESIVLTADTFDRLSDAFRIVTEPVLIADNAFHWNTYKRAFEDAWTESDATAAGLVMLRRIVEAMLFADSSALATTARRALSDTITLADSLSRVVSFKRKATDTVSISDSMARIAANLRAIQDSISVAASTLSRVADGNRQVTDSSFVIADAFKRIAAVSRRISDSLVVSDSVAALATRIVAIVDAWLTADSVGRSVASKRTVSDSFTLADSARKLVGWLRSITDSVVVSDAVGRKGTAKRTVSDTLAVSDDVRAIMVFARRIIESILLQADTLTRTTAAKRSVSDSYTVRADIISRVVASVRGILDALAIADTVARRRALGAAITETIGIADSISRKANAGRQIADALKIADAITRLADGHRGVVDYVSVSDSTRRIAAASRQIADVLAMPDGVRRVSNAVRAVADAFGIRDAGATVDLILQLLAGWLAPPRSVVWRAPPRGIAWLAPPRRITWKPKSTENLTMPVVAKEQLEKQPDEVITYAMDFSELLDANELSTTEALSSVSSVAATPSGLTLGSGSISGDRVTFSVSGGTDGETYRIAVKVVTSLGNTRIADGILKVKE